MSTGAPAAAQAAAAAAARVPIPQPSASSASHTFIRARALWLLSLLLMHESSGARTTFASLASLCTAFFVAHNDKLARRPSSWRFSDEEKARFLKLAAIPRLGPEVRTMNTDPHFREFKTLHDLFAILFALHTAVAAVAPIAHVVRELRARMETTRVLLPGGLGSFEALACNLPGFLSIFRGWGVATNNHQATMHRTVQFTAWIMRVCDLARAAARGVPKYAEMPVAPDGHVRVWSRVPPEDTFLRFSFVDVRKAPTVFVIAPLGPAPLAEAERINVARLVGRADPRLDDKLRRIAQGVVAAATSVLAVSASAYAAAAAAAAASAAVASSAASMATDDDDIVELPHPRREPEPESEDEEGVDEEGDEEEEEEVGDEDDSSDDYDPEAATRAKHEELWSRRELNRVTGRTAASHAAWDQETADAAREAAQDKEEEEKKKKKTEAEGRPSAGESVADYMMRQPMDPGPEKMSSVLRALVLHECAPRKSIGTLVALWRALLYGTSTKEVLQWVGMTDPEVRQVLEGAVHLALEVLRETRSAVLGPLLVHQQLPSLPPLFVARIGAHLRAYRAYALFVARCAQHVRYGTAHPVLLLGGQLRSLDDWACAAAAFTAWADAQIGGSWPGHEPLTLAPSPVYIDTVEAARRVRPREVEVGALAEELRVVVFLGALDAAGGLDGLVTRKQLRRVAWLMEDALTNEAARVDLMLPFWDAMERPEVRGRLRLPPGVAATAELSPRFAAALAALVARTAAAVRAVRADLAARAAQGVDRLREDKIPGMDVDAAPAAGTGADASLSLQR